MGHDRAGAGRQAVNLSLPADLVSRARACTGNLSRTVEELLDTFVAREEAARAARDESVRRTALALNAFMQEHGTIADDFSPI